MDNESTTSSSPEEPVTTQEPGAYPAIPVQEYRDGPIEEIAVRYMLINRVIENRAARNRQQEDNVRSAELDVMLDLETLIKETAADPGLIEVTMLSGGQQTITNSGRLQISSQTPDTSMGHHDGR